MTCGTPAVRNACPIWRALRPVTIARGSGGCAENNTASSPAAQRRSEPPLSSSATKELVSGVWSSYWVMHGRDAVDTTRRIVSVVAKSKRNVIELRRTG